MLHSVPWHDQSSGCAAHLLAAGKFCTNRLHRPLHRHQTMPGEPDAANAPETLVGSVKRCTHKLAEHCCTCSFGALVPLTILSPVRNKAKRNTSIWTHVGNNAATVASANLSRSAADGVDWCRLLTARRCSNVILLRSWDSLRRRQSSSRTRAALQQYGRGRWITLKRRTLPQELWCSLLKGGKIHKTHEVYCTTKKVAKQTHKYLAFRAAFNNSVVRWLPGCPEISQCVPCKQGTAGPGFTSTAIQSSQHSADSEFSALPCGSLSSGTQR